MAYTEHHYCIFVMNHVMDLIIMDLRSGYRDFQNGHERWAMIIIHIPLQIYR